MHIHFSMENLNQTGWTWVDNVKMDAVGSSNGVRFRTKIQIL